ESSSAAPAASAMTSRGTSSEAGVARSAARLSVMVPDWCRERMRASGGHPLDDLIAERGGTHLRRAGHLACEIVGDPLALDRVLESRHDQSADLLPAHVLEHHHAGEDHAARIDLVQVRVRRRGAVRRLEDGEAVADVAARRNPETTDLR